MGSVSGVLPNVGDVNNALATQQPPSRCVGRRTRRAVLPKPLAQTRYPTYRDRIKTFAIACPKRPRGRIAKGYCLLDHRLEHWVEIARRGIDHLQYLGGGGLLLERSRQFNGALLQRRFAIGNARDENPCRRRDFSDLVRSLSRHFGRTPFDLRAHVLLYPLEAHNYRAPHISEDRHPGEHAQQRGDNDQEVEMRDGLIEVCGAAADLLLRGAENRRY